MHDLDLILTLTAGLAAALVGGYVTHRLGLSPIVGYLLAGVMIGPYTPGFVARRALADQLAEIGVILLLFGVGLHFHLKDLLAVRRLVVPGAIAASLVATLLGMAAALVFGWGLSAGIVFGLAISVSSTVVLTRVLSDNNQLHTPAGHVAVGWLVVEDLMTVVALVMLPAIFADEETSAATLVWHLLLALGKIGLLVAVALVAGARIVPWLLERAAATRSRELFTLTVLVVPLGIAVGSAAGFGVSVALGAFLAGMIVGRSEYSLRAATEALTMRDAFAVLFFVSVGMLFDPAAMLESPGILLTTLVIVMLGKPTAALLIVLMRGYPARVATSVAIALAQIGEFSFILATLGRDLGILQAPAIQALIGAAIVSISLNGVLFRFAKPLALWLLQNKRLAGLTRRPQAPSIEEPVDEQDELAAQARYRAVIVGYGPVGRTLSTLLRDNGIEPAIIDLNIETVRRLREEGRAAVYGDANQRDTLAGAGLEHAGSLILSASGMDANQEVIRLAREMNPEIRVLVRSAYLRERSALRLAGADRVFSEEGEVALAMAEFILRDLGATPEKIDRERDRLRSDLFGQSAPQEEAHSVFEKPEPSETRAP